MLIFARRSSASLPSSARVVRDGDAAVAVDRHRYWHIVCEQVACERLRSRCALCGSPDPLGATLFRYRARTLLPSPPRFRFPLGPLWWRSCASRMRIARRRQCQGRQVPHCVFRVLDYHSYSCCALPTYPNPRPPLLWVLDVAPGYQAKWSALEEEPCRGPPSTP